MIKPSHKTITQSKGHALRAGTDMYMCLLIEGVVYNGLSMEKGEQVNQVSDNQWMRREKNGYV